MSFATSSRSAIRGSSKRCQAYSQRTYAAVAPLIEETFELHDPNPSSSSRPPPIPSSSPDNLTPNQAQTYLSDLLHLSPAHAFSPETSIQTLTHKSYRYAHLVRYPRDLEPSPSRAPGSSSSFGLSTDRIDPTSRPSSVSHNARFSFLGRRAVATYLALFVHSHVQSSSKLKDIDFLRGKKLQDKLDDMRHAVNIGREVGSRWGVGGVMRWDQNPNTPGGSLRIQGQTVEAIIGAIFATHGSSAAQRAFYLHVLPHISSQLRDPRLIERANLAAEQVKRETGGGVLLP